MKQLTACSIGLVAACLASCDVEPESVALTPDVAHEESAEAFESELSGRVVLERRKVGQLAPFVPPPDYPVDIEPPYDKSALVSGPNAEELRVASLRGLEVAAEYGLTSAVMSRDADGGLYVEVIDDEVAGELWKMRHGDGPAPSSGPLKDEDDLEPKGISNAIDNRVLVGTGSGYSDSHSLYRRVVDMGGCTGALFGRRLVFTAAHCNIDVNGAFQNETIVPRRRGSTYPYGSDVTTGSVWAASYTANNCHVNGTAACAKYDFAILILPSTPAFSTHPGWLGIHWAGGGVLATYSIRNAGYPRCGSGGSPAGCLSNEPYSDLTCNGMPLITSQGSTSNGWPFGNGNDPYMSSGCDVNQYHSGGPVTTYDAGSNGPYLLGNVAWHECSASCSASDDYSTGHLRINSTLAAYMDHMRTTSYP